MAIGGIVIASSLRQPGALSGSESGRLVVAAVGLAFVLWAIYQLSSASGPVCFDRQAAVMRRGLGRERPGGARETEHAPVRCSSVPKWLRRTVIRLDEASSGLRCSAADGWTVTIEAGDGMVERAFADLRAASGENLVEATRPVESLGRFLVSSLDSFPAALEGFVDASTLEGTTEKCQKHAELVRRVLAGGVSEEVDDVVGKLLGDLGAQPGPDALPIPDDPVPASRKQPSVPKKATKTPSIGG